MNKKKEERLWFEVIWCWKSVFCFWDRKNAWL